MFNACLWPFLFLVGRFSIYLLAFICTKRECCLCIQFLKPKVVPNESTIPTYMRYFHAVPSKFVCANSNFRNEFPFCVPIPLMKRQGVAIFSMLGILFSWWVFIHLSLHESVAGNRDAQPKMNFFYLCCQIINSLGSVAMEGTHGCGYPWIVEEWWKGNKHYFLFGNRL